MLQLNRYQSGSVGRLVTVDDDGEEIASLDVAEEVRDVSACGRYLSVLYADRLVVYNRQLQAYATLHGPGAHPRGADPGGRLRSHDRRGFRGAVSAIKGRIYSDVYKLFSR